jgi:hypothetical protein
MASIRTTITKNGERRYVVKYRDPAGKSREKWFRRKVDAERFDRNVEYDKDRGRYLDPRAGRAPFSEIADRNGSHSSLSTLWPVPWTEPTRTSPRT